ncbi:MAG: hypothetical protein RR640_01095 [Oscillospiraceae bacterium]
MDYLGKVAYLKGLTDGLGIDKDSKEGKIFGAIIDVLDEISITVADVEDGLVELGEQIDQIDEDLANLEEDFYEDDCDCCGEDDLYEISCPACGEEIYIDDCEIKDGSIFCPSCNEKLEFDFDCDCDDDCECDCGCEH